jgi:ribosomal-protein-alanine N-acetyltransferase
MEDAKELANLDILCFSVPWSEKSFCEEAENPLATYFVAKEDDKIIGYGGIWNVSGEGQITNIAVHPECRKKGHPPGFDRF